MNQENEIIVHQDDPHPLAPLQGSDLPALELSPWQLKALELIMGGARAAQIIKATGASRTTLWRWRTRAPNFIAALNRLRAEVEKETRDRIVALGGLAADALLRAMHGKNCRIGVTLPGRLRCLTPGVREAADPCAAFGGGKRDDPVRRAMIKKLGYVSAEMTDEQIPRAPQLLALGVAIDNLLAGRTSSVDLLEMAGPLPKITRPLRRMSRT